MADDADIASGLMDNEVAIALDRIRRSKKPQTTVTKYCIECGDLIPEARRNLGFNMCITCATEAERLRSLFAN